MIVLELSADAYDEIQKSIEIRRTSAMSPRPCSSCERMHYHRAGCPLAGTSETRP